ncbi:hypothetical protein KF7_1457 [Lactococcus lactis subsp. lactis]|nr:hypothetical protein KF7_1457 [Lactococcus lactis subsp. lactis]
MLSCFSKLAPVSLILFWQFIWAICYHLVLTFASNLQKQFYY